MELTWYTMGMCVLIIVIANIISTILLGHFTPKIAPPVKFAKADIVNLIEELHALVDLEFIAVVTAPNTVHSIETVSDFDKVQKEITSNVVKALSTRFFIMANNCGVKRSYVITVVTRRATFKLIDYMSKHNFALKK